MKKLLLLSLSVMVAAGSFAQQTLKTAVSNRYTNATGIAPVTVKNSSLHLPGTAAKTTASDTLFLVNNETTPTAYYAGRTGSDSGFLSGPNPFGFTGFAERFDVGTFQTLTANSTTTVLGVISTWAGSVAPTSTNYVTCTIWNVDSSIVADANYPSNYAIGLLPGTSLYTQQIPVNQLGLDTLEGSLAIFTAPVTVPGGFYAGFIPSFQFSAGAAAGDTIGLFTSALDSGAMIGQYLPDGNGDTLLLARSVVQVNNTWEDNYFDQGLPYNYSIIPVVQIVTSEGVASVTKNNLTVFSNYPNPAISSTNLKFALNNSADVTVQIMDITGRIINTINQPKLSAGEHTINISTTNLVAGNYVYVFRTSAGDALASEFTVMKN